MIAKLLEKSGNIDELSVVYKETIHKLGDKELIATYLVEAFYIECIIQDMKARGMFPENDEGFKQLFDKIDSWLYAVILNV